MQTVQFACVHCGKLMAVGDELRGHQVRCPHCQQVVVAPPPINSTPPPAPPPAPAEQESIFDPTGSDSALFGEAPRPVIEMPTEQIALPDDCSLVRTDITVPDAPGLPASASNPDATVVYDPTRSSDLAATVQLQHPLSEPMPPSPVQQAPGTSEIVPASSDLDALGGRDSVPLALSRSAAASNRWMILVLIPLISYAVLATIAVLILYFRPAPPDPLE